jgi:hypothetical protein
MEKTMKAEHTPGPWELDTLNCPIDGEQDITIEHQGCPICTIRGSNDMSCIEEDELEKINEEVIANACLVSAAPEMLNALLACKVTLETFLPGAFATRSLVQSALEKAKGTV